jgi:hypothetical protein
MIKKGFSIFLSILMLAAILHLSVATHYCGGKQAASRISIAGKLADCGMEGSKDEIPLSGTSLTNHCCENVITFYEIDSNYTPSFSFVPESFQHNFQLLIPRVKLSARSYTGINPLYSNTSPPGVLRSTYVDLSGICVFRI